VRQRIGAIAILQQRRQIAEASGLLCSRGLEAAEDAEDEAESRRSCNGDIVRWAKPPLLLPLTLLVGERTSANNQRVREEGGVPRIRAGPVRCHYR